MDKIDKNTDNEINYCFYFTHKVNFGEAVFLTGSSNYLGNWDLSKSIRLDCFYESIWKKDISIKKANYEYKYFISDYNLNIKNINWQQKDNIKLTQTQLDLLDQLQIDNNKKNTNKNTTNLKIMSFNLRYENSQDGIYIWKNRRDLCTNIIKKYIPDIIGVQEAKVNQWTYLKDNLNELYKYKGKDREANYLFLDMLSNAEQCGVLYNYHKFILVDVNHFWLSDTPDIEYSKTFKNTSFPRVVTWLKLLTTDLSNEIFIFNTHYDHLNSIARTLSSNVLLSQIKKITANKLNTNIFITGDFNAEENEECIFKICNDGFSLFDKVIGTKEKTFHNFTGKADIKIDHIFYKKCGQELDSNQQKNNKSISSSCPIKNFLVIKDVDIKGLYPSDHFPIIGAVVI